MENEKGNELGLGDKVEKMIESIIPNHIVSKIKESNCGCDKRKDILNKLGEDIKNINAIFG